MGENVEAIKKFFTLIFSLVVIVGLSYGIGEEGGKYGIYDYNNSVLIHIKEGELYKCVNDFHGKVYIVVNQTKVPIYGKDIYYESFDNRKGDVGYEAYDVNKSNEDGYTPPKKVKGIQGKALKLDGIDDYVLLPGFDAPDNFTIHFWVNFWNTPKITWDPVDRWFVKWTGSKFHTKFLESHKFEAGLVNNTYQRTTERSIRGTELQVWEPFTIMRTFNGTGGKLILYRKNIKIVEVNYTGSPLPLDKHENLWFGIDTALWPPRNSPPIIIDEIYITPQAFSEEQLLLLNGIIWRGEDKIEVKLLPMRWYDVKVICENADEGYAIYEKKIYVSLKPMLRDHPYPYKTSLAITSDIDDTKPETFIKLRQYLNTNETVHLGGTYQGVKLPVYDSFWMFAKKPNQIAYFDPYTLRENNRTAAIIRAYYYAGFFDFMHSYGDFNAYDDPDTRFYRYHAQMALDEMKKARIWPEIWVSHGDDHNYQSFGPYWFCEGDDQGKPGYHMDLTLYPKGPIRFGSGWFDPNWIAGEDSLHVWEMDDGRKIVEFTRYIGRHWDWDPQYLDRQLSDEAFNEMISKRGFTILAQHLGYYNTIYPQEDAAFHKLKAYYENGTVWLTSVRKLFHYMYVHKYIDWEYDGDCKYGINIYIKGISSPIWGEEILPKSWLEGITFYTPCPEKTRLYYNGGQIDVITNPPDEFGLPSIMVPINKSIPQPPHFIAYGRIYIIDRYRDDRHVVYLEKLDPRLNYAILEYIWPDKEEGKEIASIKDSEISHWEWIYVKDDEGKKLFAVYPLKNKATIYIKIGRWEGPYLKTFEGGELTKALRKERKNHEIKIEWIKESGGTDMEIDNYKINSFALLYNGKEVATVCDGMISYQTPPVSVLEYTNGNIHIKVENERTKNNIEIRPIKCSNSKKKLPTAIKPIKGIIKSVKGTTSLTKTKGGAK